MKNRWNIPGRALSIVLFGTVLGALTTIASPSSAQATAGCDTTTGAISALFLVDESTSLVLTDATAQRVEGVRDALGTLRDAAITQGRDVEVSIASFGVEYQTTLPWTTLTEESTAETYAAADQLATRQTAIDTDYMVALSGAQADLAERNDTDRCKTIVLITDGGYSIDTRTEANGAAFGLTKSYAPDVRLDELGRSAEAVTQGIDQLCRPGGVVDQLRVANIALHTVALDVALGDNDPEFISSLSSGSTAEPCGSEAATGTSQFEATPNDLRNAIAGTVAEATGASDVTQETVAVCQLLPCTQGTAVLSIDPGTGRFVVSAGFDSPAKRLILTDPNGVSITIDSEAQSDQLVGDAIANATFDDMSAVVSVVAESTVVVDGLWTATIVDSAGTGLGSEVTATVSTSQFAAVAIALGDVGPAIAGETLQIAINIVDANNQLVASDIVAATTVTAQVVDAETETTTDLVVAPDGNIFTATGVIPANFSGEGILVVEASTTIDDLAVLSSHQRTVSNTTAPIAGAPTAGPAPTEPVSDGSGGLLKMLPLLLAALFLLVIGIAVLWARANRRSLFDLDEIRVAEMPVALRANGQIDRIEPGETARQLYIRGNDFAAVGRGLTRTFAGGRLRFSGHVSLAPKAPTYGVAVGSEPVVGPLGTEDVDGKVGGIVSTDLQGQWLFELNESRTAFANHADSPAAGDLYGRLVVFVRGSLDETSPRFTDLPENLIQRGRELASSRGEAAGVDIRSTAKTAASELDSNTLEMGLATSDSSAD